MRAETELWVATLHPDKVATYEAQHQPLASENIQDLTKLGYVLLKIFRESVDVYMLVERDPALVTEGYTSGDRDDSEWRLVTDACFVRPWQRLPQIFCFSREAAEG